MNELPLDFRGTLSALQGHLGSVVFVTIGNFEAGEPQAAGFAGVLRHAQRPDERELDLVGATDDVERYTFMVGPDLPFERGWFTLDDRTFQWARHRETPLATDVVDRITLQLNGVTVQVNVPAAAYLEDVGYRTQE